MEKAVYQATGRRKSSVARVRLVPGNGKFIVNDRNFVEYIPSAAIRLDVLQPLNITETGTQYARGRFYHSRSVRRGHPHKSGARYRARQLG